MKHSYWGIACLLSIIAAIGCMVWVFVCANVWPDDLAPSLLTVLFFLLAYQCANKIVEKTNRK